MWTLALVILGVSSSALASFPAFVEDVREDIQSRIVSGWEAYDGQIPHQLGLRMVNLNGAVSACGASIISEEWGLTAAHCTANRPTIVIRAGAVHVTRPYLLFETNIWFNHPRYNNNMPQRVQPDDIGLLKFPFKLTFNHLVQPVRIQPSVDMNRNYDGVRLTASGWGRTWTDGPSPQHLNWVFLLGVSNPECRIRFNFSPNIVETTICAAGYNVTSQSTCSGDSGGPLTEVATDGRLTLVGVTSFVSGTGCHTDIPAGFVRPGHYQDWFQEITGINFDWNPSETTTTEAQTTSENWETSTASD